jgi:hypothetical protein
LSTIGSANQLFNTVPGIQTMYWSSSEHGSNTVWVFGETGSILSGGIEIRTTYKYLVASVRAIRAF